MAAAHSKSWGSPAVPQEAASSTLGVWANTAAAVVALMALSVTARSYFPLLGALLLPLANVSQRRLPDKTSVLWPLRLLALMVIYVFNTSRPPHGADWLFDARTVNIAGQMCAVELVIQSWRLPRASHRADVRLLLAGLVLLAACNTFDDSYVVYFAPLYVFLLMVSLWGHRARIGDAHLSSSRRPPALSRGLFLGVALFVGGTTQYLISTHRIEISDIGMRLLGERRSVQETSLSSTPSLGSTFEVQDSPARVLKLESYAGDGHLRGGSFDTYDHGRWLPPLDSRSGRTVTRDDLNGEARGLRSEVTRLADLNGVMLAPLNVAGIEPGSGSIDWDDANGGPLKTDEPPPSSYQIVAGDDFQQGPLCGPLSPRERERCLAVPGEIDPKVKLLAQKLAHGGVNDGEKIEAIVNHLLKNHRYSRAIRQSGGDGVSNFILQKQSAHCEYFASAAVILLRCVGIPSRYVVGYYAHEDAGGGAVVVRQRDAHAWAESWIEGVGWVTVEATPADGTPPKLSAAPSLWMRLTERVQDAVREARKIAADVIARRGALMSAAVIVALAGYLFWVFYRLSRRGHAQGTSGFDYSASAAELINLVRRFEKLLSKRGIECPPWRPWPEHLRLVRETTLNMAALNYEQALQFSKRYDAARFGGQMDDEAVRTLNDLMAKLESEAIP